MIDKIEHWTEEMKRDWERRFVPFVILPNGKKIRASCASQSQAEPTPTRPAANTQTIETP